jgi:hypothetical protein
MELFMKINILGRTGPRSLKGKSISSMNALKHGAYSKTEILPHEDAAERKRLQREMYKALRPQSAVEENLADQMIDSLWASERFKLRVAMRQENIFSQLAPSTLAELIGVRVDYRPYAPDYLKEPNTKFAKKDLKLPLQRYRLYVDLCKNSNGIANYQMVFARYQVLFEGVHEFIGNDYGAPFLLSTGAGLEVAWQQSPKKVEEILLEYAASLWYMIHFDELRPHIRHWMASWFFLDRVGRKDSDYQDDLVVKELNRYKSLLDTFIKFRKAQVEGSPLVDQVKRKGETNQRNEVPNSDSESST